MRAKTKAPSAQARPNGLEPVGNGVTPHDLGREHVIEIQRGRIVAAMAEECAERGAGNVTVAHVVARAGVSRRTFYELFGDREDCFIGAFEESIARASRLVLDNYEPAVRWSERIRAALTGLLAFLDVDRAAGRLLIVGSLGAGAKAMERRQSVVAQMVAVVDEGRGESKSGEELPTLTAEGIVGGVLSVLHSRLLASPHPSGLAPPRGGPGGDRRLDPDSDSLLALTGPLMGMIVLPYLGPAAARRELAKPVPKPPTAERHEPNPLGRLEMRLTYRTVRVLMAIAALGGRGSYPSNRAVADAAEVSDQGQMSKLLARLHDIGLIENTGGGAARGEPNAWTLTDKGWRVQGAIAQQTTGS